MTLPLSIMNMVMDQTRDWLSQKLITEVGDESRAGLVKVGKLQDDPTVAITNIMIHTATKERPHQLNANMPNTGVYAPNYTTPEGVFRRRMFSCELQFYFDGEFDRDEARRKANAILSRLEYALGDMPLGFHDDFGEVAFMLQTQTSYIEEGGGDGTYIWKGCVDFDVYTDR